MKAFPYEENDKGLAKAVASLTETEEMGLYFYGCLLAPICDTALLHRFITENEDLLPIDLLCGNASSTAEECLASIEEYVAIGESELMELFATLVMLELYLDLKHDTAREEIARKRRNFHSDRAVMAEAFRSDMALLQDELDTLLDFFGYEPYRLVPWEYRLFGKDEALLFCKDATFRERFPLDTRTRRMAVKDDDAPLSGYAIECFLKILLTEAADDEELREMLGLSHAAAKRYPEDEKQLLVDTRMLANAVRHLRTVLEGERHHPLLPWL